MSDVYDAFSLLEEAVDKEIVLANEKGAELLRSGELGQAKQLMEKSEKLGSLKKQVGALRRSYAKVGQTKERRRQRMGGTPQEAFQEPILEVLRRMGGKGKAREVVGKVGEMMGSRLENEIDQEPLSDGSPRWMNRCWWARNDLREQGKLKSGSRRGTWELS